METTKVLIEYVIAGVLVLLALAFLLASVFGLSLPDIAASLQGVPISDKALDITLSVCFLSVAYAVGVIAEYFGMESLEWLMNRVKRRRIVKFLEENEPNLRGTPIFEAYMAQMPKETSKSSKGAFRRRRLEIYGRMRFHVLQYSPSLYTEINDQLNRSRLTRVLLLVELIVLAGILIQMRQGQLAPDTGLALLIVLAIFTLATALSVYRRFDHYCRAVERGYIELIQSGSAASSKAGKGFSVRWNEE
jgi:hypothetical protein